MLFYCDFGAADGLAGEQADLADLELDHTVMCGVDREVAAEEGALTRTLGLASLADDDLAGFDLLATKNLNAEALAGTVAVVFTGTTSFDV